MADGGSRSKHIDISYHITREQIEFGAIKLQHQASAENKADMMTKYTPGQTLKNFCEDMNLTG